MSKLKYEDRIFEVEARQMDNQTLNVAFIDEDDFGEVYGWAKNADLSRIVVDNDGEEEVFEGFTDLKAVVALQATQNDFWEGMRLVVALGKPAE